MMDVEKFNSEVREFQHVVLDSWGRAKDVQDRLERERLGYETRDNIRVRDGIKRSMFALWLQDQENELLKLIVHKLEVLGWKVVALVFDGVIVEHNPDVGDLGDALRDVEKWLKDYRPFDWDVALAEKGLFGKQNDAVRTVEEAENVLRQVLLQPSEERERASGTAGGRV